MASTLEVCRWRLTTQRAALLGSVLMLLLRVINTGLGSPSCSLLIISVNIFRAENQVRRGRGMPASRVQGWSLAWNWRRIRMSGFSSCQVSTSSPRRSICAVAPALGVASEIANCHKALLWHVYVERERVTDRWDSSTVLLVVQDLQLSCIQLESDHLVLTVNLTKHFAV